MIGLANTLHKMLNLFTFSILGYVLISWLSHGGYNPFLDLIKSISLPLLSRTRRLLPSLGGLDFSPMLAIILLQLIIMLVIIPLKILDVSFFNMNIKSNLLKEKTKKLFYLLFYAPQIYR